MSRTQRRDVARLPTSLHAWEIGLVEVPMTIEGVETEGMLVVVESASDKVRTAGPVVVGEPLWPMLHQAFTEPAPPCSPARPRRLLCSDSRLTRRLRKELKGLKIGIEQVASVPAVDAVIASLQAHFAPVLAPGITLDQDLWASALETLARTKPWQRVSDGVLFRFEGTPVLDGAVAIVLGLAGEQRGIALYPSEEDYERFLKATLEKDTSAFEELEALNLYLDPVQDLEPEEVAACQAMGLVTTDGLYPRVAVLAGGRLCPAHEPAQRILLAVVQGITALTAAAEDLQFNAAEGVALTVHGSLNVRSTPAGEPAFDDGSDLTDAEHAIAVGMIRIPPHPTKRPALILKLRKPDAKRLASTLAQVDGLRIEAVGGEHDVRAMVGSVDLGRLVRLWQVHDVHSLTASGRVLLCVSAGGPQRPRIRTHEFVFTREVEVVGAPASRSGHSPLFDEPVDRWPKSSETLLRFAGPLLPGDAAFHATRIQGALEMAMTVWNAVVMSDLAGDPQFLHDVQRGVRHEAGPRAIVAMLIDRKRTLFAGDPRILGPVRVDAQQAVPQVFVEARLPPGYRVGTGERT